MSHTPRQIFCIAADAVCVTIPGLKQSSESVTPRSNMRMKEISVKGLFGIFDHTVPMSVDDRITIIHGPNGFGKTAILRLVDGLFNSRYSELRTIPFRVFETFLEDGSVLRVNKVLGHKQEAGTNGGSRISISYSKGSEKESFSLPGQSKSISDLDFPVGAIDEIIPELERISPRTWRNLSTSEVLTLDDVLERYEDMLPIAPSKGRRDPPWFKQLRNSIDVRFIQTQRLFSLGFLRDRSRKYGQVAPMKAVVSEYSAELAGAIKSTLGEYATLSQSLDRTFPARLVKEEISSDITLKDLRGKLGELEEKRSQLTEAGLLDQEKDDEFQVPQIVEERTKGVLSVYVKDVQQKLSTLDEIAAKIDLFKTIINERFRYKQMTVSKDMGITFTTLSGEPLSPTSLSSGEQQELVLFYEFLFKVKPDSLILIDEPEISLHVAWQEQFLRDVQKITKLASFDVLIATHSPQIIYDRWDLTVELRGPAENGQELPTDQMAQAPALAS
jgi:predicted ATP-binding protein involved in virulence